MNESQKVRRIEWYVLSTILPVSIYLLLCWRDFSLFQSILPEESLSDWHILFLLLGGYLTLSICYAISTKFYGNFSVHALVSPIVLLLHTFLLWLFLTNDYRLYPREVPAWMSTGSEAFIYPLTFLIPGLLYAVLVGIIILTPEQKKQRIWLNLLSTVLIPIFLYIGYLFLEFLRNKYSFDPQTGDYVHNENFIFLHSVVISSGFVIGFFLFLFFLFRSLLLIWRKSEIPRSIKTTIVVLFCIIFPILGLLLNNQSKLLDLPGFRTNEHIFGDYKHPLWYILAVLNGILIILPSPNDRKWRSALTFGRFLLVPYTLYFALVFLPYLPFAFFGLFLFGVGLLMFAPFVLAFFHTQVLSVDLSYFREKIGISNTVIFALISVSILPAFYYAKLRIDRYILHSALEYLYEPDFRDTKSPYFISSLEGILDHIQTIKEGNRFNFLSGSNSTPYLDSWYNRTVLDNLVLSDEKIETLYAAYSGKQPIRRKNSSCLAARCDSYLPPEDNAKLISVSAKTENFDHYYKSTIELTTKYGQGWAQGDYITQFTLADGAFISDYYLFIGSHKEQGILSERKSALWIYNQIRNFRKDPGILHYVSPNRLELRVFPYSKGEIRKTGFTILHSRPVNFSIDGKEIHLEGNDITIQSLSSVFVSEKYFAKLPEIKRTPKYYFILDNSKYSSESEKVYQEFVNKYADKSSVILWANYEVEERNKENAFINIPAYKGGFLLERTLRSIFVKHYLERDFTTYPVPIVVTNQNSFYGKNHELLVWEKNLSDISFLFPESPRFYYAIADSKTQKTETYLLSLESDYAAGKLISGDLKSEISKSRSVVRIFGDLQNNGFLLNAPGVYPIPKKESGAEEIQDGAESEFQQAISLESLWKLASMNPNTYQWKRVVAESFSTKILSPHTAYLALEDDAQKEALRRKQKEVLSSKPYLDGEELIQMSEPTLFDLVLLLLLSIGFIKIRLIKEYSIFLVKTISKQRF
ncbi:MSEP-CTERM sorting domain-containing protein [Leptospira perolatii]|uniref:MSEP-CTERM sorting domain-containing protein n=1 Tax=Leptospira perolatii TaxID=2023191 RepID=A0A2M9ZSI7_9LEPT|nr:MSEP-CTERM sorting domain-containing protein [Leptospira perolatii]PJZ71502.1 MSEP-CTERM sorting domain-containing protein [Leptospira perolatii]PJZ75036.1 MSEP-CTERM sorting domain-containing protein [Leptospira perolatii]